MSEDPNVRIAQLEAEIRALQLGQGSAPVLTGTTDGVNAIVRPLTAKEMGELTDDQKAAQAAQDEALKLQQEAIRQNAEQAAANAEAQAKAAQEQAEKQAKAAEEAQKAAKAAAKDAGAK